MVTRMNATQTPTPAARNLACAVDTTQTFDDKIFTVTADDRLFFGDDDVLLSAFDADIARHLADNECCGELKAMFDAYRAELAAWLADQGDGEPLMLFDVEVIVPGYAKPLQAEVLAADEAAAISAAADLFSAKLAVDPDNVHVCLAPQPLN